jgi:hypothetical protein
MKVAELSEMLLIISLLLSNSFSLMACPAWDWSSKQWGFADWLGTFPKRNKLLISKDTRRTEQVKRPNPWMMMMIMIMMILSNREDKT